MRARNFFFNAEGGEGGGAAAPGTLLSGGSATQEQQQQPPPVTATPGWVKPDGSWDDGVFDRLPDELKSARATLEKYPTFQDFAKSHMGLLAKLGKGANGVMVPGEKSTPEEVAAYRQALGVPESVDGYKIRPDQLPEGVEWNDASVKPYLEVAHKHNIPPAAMKELVALNLQQEQARIGVTAEMAERSLKEGDQVLRQSFGQNYEKNVQRAQMAAKVAGLDPLSPGLTDPQVVIALARLGEKIGEDKLVQPGGMSNAQLAGKGLARDIQTNPENPKYKKYQEGDQETVDYVRSLLKNG